MMRHPNNNAAAAAPYTTTTRSSGPRPPPPHQSSPRHIKLFSPRQQQQQSSSSSSKRNHRVIALTKSTIVPLLMALIVLSSITNLYRLEGGGGGGGGGVVVVDTDDGGAAASSSSMDPILQPPPRQDGGEKKQRLLVRHDKTARKRNNDAVVRAAMVPNDAPLVDSRTGGGDNDLHHNSQKRQSSRRENAAINGYYLGQNLHNENNSQRRFTFRPHPATTEASRLHRSYHNMALPKPAISIKLNRSVCLDGKYVVTDNNADADNLEYWLGETAGNSSNDELAYRTQTVVWDHDDECVPMSTWQFNVHPTCNSLHELDISQLINDEAFSLVSSKGFWRNAWRVDLVERPDETETANSSPDHHPPQPPPRILERSEEGNNGESVKQHVVLKSIKYIHEANKEVFELSRVDAISLDVLTKSRFTINIHGYCGSSSIQASKIMYIPRHFFRANNIEFAGGDLKGLLPVLDPIDKLRMAAWLANGVADIHAVDSWNATGHHFDNAGARDNAGAARAIDSSDGPADADGIADDAGAASAESNVGSNGTATPVSLIHNDINMDNILLGYRDGIETPLINDFNIAVFRKRNERTGSPCLFRGRFANPQWMSPEQQERERDELSTGKLDEKIDIYALGNILYKIAVGSSPWKYDYNVNRITEKEKMRIARAKLKGRKPKVPAGMKNSTIPIRAVLTAMNKCYRNDARLRPTARELAAYLQSELDAIELPIKVMNRFEFDV